MNTIAAELPTNQVYHPTQFGFKSKPMTSIADTGFQRRVLTATEGGVVDPHFYIDQVVSSGITTLSLTTSTDNAQGIALEFDNPTSALIATLQPAFCHAALWLLLEAINDDLATAFIEGHVQLPDTIETIATRDDLTTQTLAEVLVAGAGATVNQL